VREGPVWLPMRLLFLSSEVAPYSKTGGLGDVAGALPVAMAALGHEVRVVSPLYQTVPGAGLVPQPQPLTLAFPFGEVEVRFRTRTLETGLTEVFVEAPALFDRPTFYGHPDDDRRFAAFTMAALSWAQQVGFDADVVWCHDWQTGLAPLALRLGYARTALGRARTLFTIHNLAYQGNFPSASMEALGIPWSQFTLDGVEFWGQLGFLKAGLAHADLLSTVSPSYAGEIQTLEGGVGLDGLLRARAPRLSGILNGVDTREWNPATDALLPARFSAADLTGRAVNRAALLAAFGLDAPGPGFPLFGVVGRMVDQKGADLMQFSLPAFLEQGAGVVVLGSGDAGIVERWKALHARFPRRLGLHLGFDNALAHLIEAGSDFFLMPSRFEPCGLNQMYSLLYGAVPVVRAVGGLKDTVTDLQAPGGTGVVFGPATVSALTQALLRAVDLYRQPDQLRAIQGRGMIQDFSWAAAARRYTELLQAPLPP
jgi:starch synthase